MARVRLVLLGWLAALAACASVAADPPPTYYVTRHLQKGEGQDPGLTELGRRNAVRLAERLRPAPPAAIFASATRRARETAQPSVERYSLQIQEYDPRDTPALVARLRATPGPVLVVGHSNTVPAIIEALEGHRVGEIGEGDYGTLYRLSGPGKGVVRVTVDSN